MPDTTNIQSLPLILPSQAQKHVTHNEALKILDLIVQMTVVSRSTSVPPSAPALGDAHIVGAGATGLWAGHGGKPATFTGIVWEFYVPKTGWTAYVVDEAAMVVYDGTDWISAAEGPGQFTQLGVSATADATNRLTVSAPATLFNHDGAGHQVKVNKATSGDTASLMFQTGFSGRAEMGTAGSDDFAIKVSANGSTFTEAVSFSAGTGRTRVQNGLRITPAVGDLAGPVDGEVWYDSTTGKFRARQNGASVDLITVASGGSSFVDGSFVVTDDVDPTKQMRLQIGSLGTGTTRTLSMPTADGVIATLSGAAQTFANTTTFSGTTVTVGTAASASTLGLGTGATTTGLTKAINIGTAGLSGSTTTIAIGSAVAGALGSTTFQTPTVGFGATVTAINLPDVATFITDNADPAKKLQFEVSGISSGSTRTVTAPNESGTMVLAAATQTLTNKTISLSANTVTGTLPATSIAMTGGGTVQDYTGFSTRSAFVTWASGKTPATGAILDAAGFSYRYIGTGTAIGDLPGWVPLGYAFPDHWGQNVTPGTTNMHAALTTAIAYSATVYLAGGVYAVGATLAWDNATLIGNNDRGTARTKILGLSALIPIGNAIVAPGRSATMRGIQLGYDTLTGTETQDQRVGLDTRGLVQNLQRGSVLDELVIENVGTAISDYGDGEFSVTYGTMEIGAHSYRAVDIRGTIRTGSVWLNLYINGNNTYTPEGGFCLTGQAAGGFVAQLNIEHCAYSGYPVRLEGLQGMSINSLHIEGVDCTTAGFGYVGLDSASVTIHSLNVTNTRMSTDNTAVVRLARAGYQAATVVPLLTVVSQTSNLKIGKLHVKGLASPSNALYPSYPVGRTGVRNCPGFNVFKRDTSYTDNNWSIEVQDFVWAAYTAQVADQPLLEYPDLSYSGQIQMRRVGDRGTSVVAYENYVQNGAFDKWLATTATVTSGATEVANKWTLRGASGSVTLDRVQDAYGALGQYDARATVTTAGTDQSLDQDIAFPVEWLGQPLRLTFDMKAAMAGRVFDQITATLVNAGGGTPATVTKQVLNGTNTKLDATTGFKTFVLDFTAVDPALVTVLGTAAVMRLSFVINGATAARSPTVTLANVALAKTVGARFARSPYDRLALGAGDVAGLGGLATASTVNLTTQATGILPAAQAPAHVGDVTSAAGSLALTIAAGAVSNAKLAAVDTARIKGRTTAGSGEVEDLTGTQATALLDGFTSAAKGLVPASGGGTTNFLRADGTWTAPAGGGGGVPGGSTTQMQFNNAGVFAGATEVQVENNQLRLLTAGSLTTPAAGGVKLVSRADAGRNIPAFLTQDGVLRELQASLARSSPVIWKAQPGSTVITAIGAAAPTAVGTATVTSVATTNLVNRTPRIEFLVTTAATTAVAGFRGTTNTVTVGAAVAGQGGLAMVGRWGPSTGVAIATHRAFFGLANVTVAPTDVEPSTTVSCVAMGWDAADTNIQMMHNDATGICTKIDLGASFPVPVTDRANLYELSLYSPRGTTQSVEWLVTDLVSGTTASGTITTNLPTNTTLLAPRGWISVGGTSSVIGFGLSSLVLDPLL